MEKKKKGRPSKITTISLKQVETLAGYGLTEEEIADVLGICRKTLYTYKKDNPDFLHTLKVGKSKADNNVVKSLYQRALGYEHEEVKLFCDKGRIVSAKVIRHYPPDATSLIFWLKNRRPDKWRDKQEIDHGLSEPLMEKYKDISGKDLIEKARELIGDIGSNQAPETDQPT